MHDFSYGFRALNGVGARFCSEISGERSDALGCRGVSGHGLGQGKLRSMQGYPMGTVGFSGCSTVQ